MSVIMAIFSAFAPPQDKPDTGSGNSGQIQQEVKKSLDAAIDIAVTDARVAKKKSSPPTPRSPQSPSPMSPAISASTRRRQ